MPELKITPEIAYQMFAGQRDRLLPLDTYEKAVSPEIQAEDLNLIRETLSFERFFFVINLHRMELEHVNGVFQWLGYDDDIFTLPDFLSIIHPSHFSTHNITATQLIEDLMRGRWQLEYMKHRYINEIALKCNNGKYVQCKRLACVFQHTPDGKLLEYLNEFTIVGPYTTGKPYSIRALHKDGTNEFAEDMHSSVRFAFEEKKFFSYQELRLLRKWAYQPGMLVPDMAMQLAITRNSVKTYEKRIKKKATDLYRRDFHSAKEVAQFLHLQGLI